MSCTSLIILKWLYNFTILQSCFVWKSMKRHTYALHTVPLGLEASCPSWFLLNSFILK